MQSNKAGTHKQCGFYAVPSAEFPGWFDCTKCGTILPAQYEPPKEEKQ